MATDTERLALLIEANTKSYENAMRRIEQKTDKAIRTAQGSVKRLDTEMKSTAASAATLSKALNFGKAGLAGLAAGAGIGSIGGIAAAVRSVTSSLAELKAEAARAGIPVEEFQELSYAAAKSKVSTDALTDGLKEMQLRADEFAVTGQGSGAEAFARLGFGADELREKLKDPSALFLEIIGRLEKLDTASRIRVSDELFGGTGGEQFVQMLGRGEQGIRNLMGEARSAGQVLDTELIDRAVELDAKFNAIVGTVGTALKQAIVNAASGFDIFLDKWREVDERTTKGLQYQLQDIYNERAEVQDLIRAAEGSWSPFSANTIDQNKKRLDALADQAMKIRDVLDRRAGYSEHFVFKPPGEEPGTGVGIPPPAKPDAAAKAIDRQREAVKALIADLEFENQITGQSVETQRVLTALRQAGSAATNEQAAQIVGLVQQNIALEEAQKRAVEAQEQMVAALDTVRDTAGSALSAFNNSLRQGEGLAGGLKSALDRVLDTVIRIAEQQAIAALLGPMGSSGTALFGKHFTIPFKERTP